MHEADLSFATLLRADLSGINKLTSRSMYEESQKLKCNFSNRNLCDANISDSKLHGVNLTDADLYRANLRDSEL